MSHFNPDIAARREAARAADGRFGNQPHTPPTEPTTTTTVSAIDLRPGDLVVSHKFAAGQWHTAKHHVAAVEAAHGLDGRVGVHIEYDDSTAGVHAADSPITVERTRSSRTTSEIEQQVKQLTRGHSDRYSPEELNLLAAAAADPALGERTAARIRRVAFLLESSGQAAQAQRLREALHPKR